MHTKITKKKALYIFKKLEQWTRADIISRHGDIANLAFADAAMAKIDIENKIREVLYGSSDLVALGIEWGLLKDRKIKEPCCNSYYKKQRKKIKIKKPPKK